MTTKLSTGRARIRRSTAALGIAGLALAGFAGPALADGQEESSAPDAVEQTIEEEEAASVVEDDVDAAVSDQENANDSGESGEPALSEVEEDDSATGGFQPMAILRHEVDLLVINDFHGRIDAGLKVEGGVITSEGAAVHLAAAIEETKAANPATYFVGAGDLYSASTFTSMAADDIPTIEVLNELGLETSAVGNHEFDQGFGVLKERQTATGKYLGEKPIGWPYLGANVYDKTSADPAMDEFHIVNTGTVSIAFIGVVTEETPSLVTPTGVADLSFGGLTQAVNRVADYPAVKAADAIVLLVHDGGATTGAVTDPSTNFGAFVKAMADRGDIAAIFSGHTHQLYNLAIPITADSATITEMPVIQTGSFGENIGKITLAFDIKDDTAVLAEATAEIKKLREYAIPTDSDFVDEVRTLVMEAVSAADEIGSKVIGEAGADLKRARHYDPKDGSISENRGGESTISNLIADAQLWAASKRAAEVAPDDVPVLAFMNPGGVRANIDAGNVTYKQVAGVQPFANTLETFDLTGAQIKDVLEEQWQPDGVSRPFLKLGLSKGFEYTYDPDKARGERIQGMWLDGAPIDPEATYRVVANNFLAAGGDNFFTLAKGKNYADTGLVDLAAFVDYFESHEGAVDPDYKKRAMGVHFPEELADGYYPGQVIPLNLSALHFTNNEPKVKKILAQLLDGNGDPVGDPQEFDVNDEWVSTTDETGRADVRYKIPAGHYPPESGPYTLALTDDLGGEYERVAVMEFAVSDTEIKWGDIRIEDCTLIIPVSTVGVGTFHLAIGHDGEMIFEESLAIGDDWFGNFKWKIDRVPAEDVSGIGLYVYDDFGNEVLDADPYEIPADVAAACEKADSEDPMAGDDDKDGDKEDGGDKLPDTGADVNGLIVVGALLLAAGAATMVARRRVIS